MFADRRITDVSRADDRVAALRQRAVDFAPGDTDLAWTRITPWRAALASAFDGWHEGAASAAVDGDDADPSALLLAGWLSARLGFYVPVNKTGGGSIDQVRITLADGAVISADEDYGRLILRREGQQDSIAPFPERSLGELLAEELRRLDADQVFAEALGAVSGLSGLNDRPDKRSAHLERPGAGRLVGGLRVLMGAAPELVVTPTARSSPTMSRRGSSPRWSQPSRCGRWRTSSLPAAASSSRSWARCASRRPATRSTGAALPCGGATSATCRQIRLTATTRPLMRGRPRGPSPRSRERASDAGVRRRLR